MATSTTDTLGISIRDASRELVRELGFMESTLAGTDLPASAVHAILEIGGNNVKTALALGATLNLDESSVDVLLRNLVQAGEIREGKNDSVAGETSLSLTPAGQKTIAKINAFAQEQVKQTLAQLSPSAAKSILEGLRKYASALRSNRFGHPIQNSDIVIKSGYRPGLVGRTIEMHMQYYSRDWGMGSGFEAQLATGLGKLLTRLDKPESEAWVALDGSKIIGTIFIDGEDLGGNKAHLRAFIVDDGLRGGGIGRQLLEKALAFVDEREFPETHLWTFKGLEAARHLYLSTGFVLESEFPGYDWGENTVVQQYVRRFEGD
jgi:DNA-binding MarR family transcriptional regulator/GNAT superfamily N-acetyltransferase